MIEFEVELEFYGVEIVCRHCSGSSGRYRNGWKCGHCNGTGKVIVVRLRERNTDVQENLAASRSRQTVTRKRAIGD